MTCEFTASSALRLSVWLFDDFNFGFLRLYQNYLLTFGAEKRKIFQFSVRPYFDTGFAAAYWAAYPFDPLFHISPPTTSCFFFGVYIWFGKSLLSFEGANVPR